MNWAGQVVAAVGLREERPPLPCSGGQTSATDSTMWQCALAYYNVVENGNDMQIRRMAITDAEGLSADDKPLWDKLLNDDNSRIAFRCTGPIGASDGAATEYICFELDATTPSCTDTQ
jgi:hypothetical protein